MCFHFSFSFISWFLRESRRKGNVHRQECFKVWLKIPSLAFLLLQRNAVMLVSESPVSIQIDVTFLIKGSRKVWGTALLIYALNGNRLRYKVRPIFL